jgi:DNA-binding transcriptional LysR family regulator
LELEEAEAEIREEDLAPRGKIRVSLPTVFGKIFAVELLSEFTRRFPELRLELSLVDHYVDLIEEGIDLALRVGPVNDDNLSARRLCANRRLLVAAPSYLERHGHPQSVAELSAHTCILFSGFRPATKWNLVGAEGAVSACVSGNVQSNNMHVVARCAAQGLGLAPGATMSVAQHLINGELLRVLPAYEFEPTSVFAVYPSNRQLSTKVRPVVNFLAEQLGDPPMWDQRLQCTAVLRSTLDTGGDQ